MTDFARRHNGLQEEDIQNMLSECQVSSLDELINKTIPGAIRNGRNLALPDGISEYRILEHLRKMGSSNKRYRSYIGMGYYNTVLPGVIQRNVLENPGWYTAYTPYQAEISQGRLEALLNFQTMIAELTRMPIANCSLLDEGGAAAEAMIMLYNARPRQMVKEQVSGLFISESLFPQTLDVLQTRAEPLGIRLITGAYDTLEPGGQLFGAMVQFPDDKGCVHDYRAFIKRMHEHNIPVAVVTDLLSLAVFTPPGEWGADVVVGSSQRFGVPMGYGGPHAGFIACTEPYKRSMPGRIIGVSRDARGDRALRMALQTREQHIKRERATSNICTAQALLAVMAGFYGAYYGAKGLSEMAGIIRLKTATLAGTLMSLGLKQLNEVFFDTLYLRLPEAVSVERVQQAAVQAGINFRYFDKHHVGISLDETADEQDLNDIIAVFELVCGKSAVRQEASIQSADLERTTPFMRQEVFNRYRSETDMMRYMKKLENMDLALNRTMIPLGSCTMKLNAGAELFALSWPEFNSLHPFVPADQALGYRRMIEELEHDLGVLSGFPAISLQPNSGATGEFAGLMVIREYHRSRGEAQRNIVLIPASAHGTNPASAVMAGGQVVVVRCDDQGNIDMDDLRAKATEHRDQLSCLMITYPSTHGVFEEQVKEVIAVVHECGGQVYMDGANMNAQVGFTSPGHIGADVCHINLHKTFAIPHGGGGPGMGPIGVAQHLADFLPRHPVVKTGGRKGITAIASAPYGSALILTISYAYIKMMGGDGLTQATCLAILNANYLRQKLQSHYPVLYTGEHGFVAHEMILDCNGFGPTAGISAIDIAKRLMDYGFHAPTVAFPVPGTLMVEPTESESKEELDRFVEAMIAIRQEIAAIENGSADKVSNLLKNAPHTAEMITADKWEMPYSRQQAAYPVKFERITKYWPPVTRIDDAFGDRNLMCTCEPVDGTT